MTLESFGKEEEQRRAKTAERLEAKKSDLGGLEQGESLELRLPAAVMDRLLARVREAGVLQGLLEAEREKCAVLQQELERVRRLPEET